MSNNELTHEQVTELDDHMHMVGSAIQSQVESGEDLIDVLRQTRDRVGGMRDFIGKEGDDAMWMVPKLNKLILIYE